MMTPQHKQIIDLLLEFKPTLEAESITFSNEDRLKETLQILDINFTRRDFNNTLSIETEDFPVKIYQNKASYLRLGNIKNDNTVILDDGDGNILSLNQGKLYINVNEDNDNYFFSNALAYKELISFFKEQDVDEEDTFHFVDYVNDASRRIVFTSLSDKGRIIINYDNEVSDFDDSKNYQLGFEIFKKCFDEESKNLPKFLKNSVIEFASRFPKEQRIIMLFENLEEVSTKAKINFEIYLNGLSIQKIVKEYDEYKSKYFKELSDILHNLTNKIIGFPLLITTTLFAIEKVKGTTLFMIIIICALTISAIYLLLLLQANFKDLAHIKYIVKKDYKTLTDNNFFIKYPNQIDDFKKIKQKIDSRVSYLEIISESYYWLLGISNIGIIGLTLNYLNIEKGLIYMFLIVAVFILSLCRNNILHNYKINSR